MFQVSVNKQNYKVCFRKYRQLGITTCAIYNTEHDLIACEQAHCSIKDSFVRNTGRKVALTRALMSVQQFTKDDRSAFWSAYFKARNGKF
jgi:hypothetical protein